jgi:hypothetical protein
MIKQSDAIRDYVFPIAEVEKDGNNMALKRFLGTGYLISNRVFGMTAVHVVQTFNNANNVAIIKIAGDSWKSFFRLSKTREDSSLKYHMFALFYLVSVFLVSGIQKQSE